MSSESVCQIARSWVDVGSFHTRLVARFMIFTASVRNILDTRSYTLHGVDRQLDPHLLDHMAYTSHNPIIDNSSVVNNRDTWKALPCAEYLVCYVSLI
jgi:hypothetical protein